MVLFVHQGRAQKVQCHVRKVTFVHHKQPMPPCMIISVLRDFSVFRRQGALRRRKTIVRRLTTVRRALEIMPTLKILLITRTGEETLQLDVPKELVMIILIQKRKCWSAT